MILLQLAQIYLTILKTTYFSVWSNLFNLLLTDTSDQTMFNVLLLTNDMMDMCVQHRLLTLLSPWDTFLEVNLSFFGYINK